MKCGWTNRLWARPLVFMILTSISFEFRAHACRKDLEAIPRPSHPVRALNDLIEAEGFPELGVAYAYVDSFGYAAKVIFTRALIKQLERENSRTILMFLQALIRANTNGSGVRSLKGHGSEIMEVRAFVHGHKRIFGCFRDQILTLKTMIALNISSGQISRRLGLNFCRD